MKYVTKDPDLVKPLSRTACAILMLLCFQCDSQNLVNKAEFIRRCGMKMDPRTWSKYWRELENKGILEQVNAQEWMVSPHHCYGVGMSQQALVAEWNRLTQ